METLIKLYIVNDFPTFFQPSSNTGILSKINKVPIDINMLNLWNTVINNWERPENPTEYTFAGTRKKFMPMANIKALTDNMNKRLTAFKNICNSLL